MVQTPNHEMVRYAIKSVCPRAAFSMVGTDSVEPKRQIGLGDVILNENAYRYVQDVLDSRRLTYGPYHRKFEARFSELHKCRYSIFCNSGTSALQVALHAIRELRDFEPGAEVLVPAITFVATANIVVQNGLTPIFVDVDPLYYCIDPNLIEKHITNRTRAIIPVHMFGQPADMDPIMDIARKRDLAVIEDSCECMFASYRGASVGSIGDAAAFSTYASHLLTTGVGGFVTTSDGDVAAISKSLMNHGRDGIYTNIDDDSTEDMGQLFNIVDRRFSFVRQGYSYRATEFEAAIGVAQLEDYEEMVRSRRERADWFADGLGDLGDRLQLPAVREGSEHNFMMYPLVVRDETIERDDLVHFLEEHGIETRRMMPLIDQPVYVDMFGPMEHRYPVASWINRCGFYVACHPGLDRADVDHICEWVHQYFGRVRH